MHHHSTKQRLAALRRRLGIQLTPPKWARERSRRFKEAAIAARNEAAAAVRAATDEATRQIVAALTPAPGVELTPAPLMATGGGTELPNDAPTTIAEAPYPSQHLSATDAARSRPSGGGGDGGGDGGRPGGSGRWVWIVLVILAAAGFAVWFGVSKKEEPVAKAPPPAPAPVQAAAPEPPPPPPPAPPSPAPALKQLTVAKGDCLWRLSAAHLGDPNAWRRLYETNRGKIRNPDLIYPGQTIELP